MVALLQSERNKMDGQLTIFDYLIKPVLWKYDSEYGIAYYCSACKRFVCSSGTCECGAIVNINMVINKEYKGKTR